MHLKGMNCMYSATNIDPFPDALEYQFILSFQNRWKIPHISEQVLDSL
jgi:hypothetical protein